MSNSSHDPVDDSPVRTALVCSALHSPGGACNHILQIYRGLDRRRYLPRIYFYSRVREEIEARYLAAGVEAADLSFVPLRESDFFYGFVRGLAEAFARDRIRLAHSFFLHSDILTAAAVRHCRGLALISSVEGRFILDRTNGVPFWKQGIYRHLNRRVRPVFQSTISVSRSLADEVRQAGGRTRRLVTIPVGFRDPGTPPPVFEKRTVTVGTMGRFEDDKGMGYFVDCVSRLRDRNPSLRFLLAGDGRLKEQVSRRILALGLEAVLEERNWVENPEEFFREVDVFVMPSKREGCPLGLLEAMAFARPVAAFNVPGVNEVLGHGKEGFLARPFDIGELSEHIVRLAENPSESRAMGLRGRKKILTDFTPEGEIHAIQEEYDRALSRSEGPRQAKPGRFCSRAGQAQ